MVGVVHANSPIDGIQRFIGKIELGIIPSILDTVVFVKDGGIEKVYELELKVKVPSGNGGGGSGAARNRGEGL